MNRISIACLMLSAFFLGQAGTLSTESMIEHNNMDIVCEDQTKHISNTNVLETKYVLLGVPNINSSFKAYMDYRTITNKNSAQYKYISQNGWSDSQGFMRANADIGISDDYYLIALGSYYGTEIGTKYRFTTNTGNVFYGVLADCKNDIHTNSTNQYTTVGTPNVVEFIVDTRKLNKNVKYHGSANAYSPLKGSIVKIERLEV